MPLCWPKLGTPETAARPKHIELATTTCTVGRSEKSPSHQSSLGAGGSSGRALGALTQTQAVRGPTLDLQRRTAIPLDATLESFRDVLLSRFSFRRCDSPLHILNSCHRALTPRVASPGLLTSMLRHQSTPSPHPAAKPGGSARRSERGVRCGTTTACPPRRTP